MSYSFSLQEFESTGRPLGDITARETIRRLLREGVDLCGLGASHLPLLTFFPALGIRILSVRDRVPPSDERQRAIRAQGARLVTGEGYLEGLSAGVILRTPSLRPDTPALSAARAGGALITTEAALLLALTPADIFAVTGSDGKTTTAMMTAAMLKAAGRRVFLGGNIGTPLLPRLPDMKPGDAAVLELSSFQLSDMAPPHGRAAITNITENHLDWHTDMEEYAAAKARILGGGVAVLNGDCPETAALAAGREAILFTLKGKPYAAHPTVWERDGTVALDREPLFPKTALTLPGRHNLANAMAAAALVHGAVPPHAMEAALRTFRPAPHRAEYVGTFGGVACYDSSIDTTPARTATTLASFDRPAVLLGGRGKRLSLRPLVDALLGGAAAAILTGECAPELEEAIREADPEGQLPLLVAGGFAEAVTGALSLCRERGIRTLLLSPAATSFDAFPDYRARGRAFAAILSEQHV